MTPWSYGSRDFAIKAHEGQSYGGFLYEVHLDHVVQVLTRFGIADDSRIVDAAFLHDTLEDTDVTYDDIKKAFGWPTAKIVDAVSDGEGKNRRERKERPYTLIPKVAGALPVKLADRIANVESCWALKNESLKKAYYGEYPTFVERLYYDESPEPVQRMWAYLRAVCMGW